MSEQLTALPNVITTRTRCACPCCNKTIHKSSFVSICLRVIVYPLVGSAKVFWPRAVFCNEIRKKIIKSFHKKCINSSKHLFSNPVQYRIFDSFGLWKQFKIDDKNLLKLVQKSIPLYKKEWNMPHSKNRWLAIILKIISLGVKI